MVVFTQQTEAQLTVFTHRRYNFKSTKKQKLDTDDDEDDEGDIEESVRTITAMFKSNGNTPSSLEFRHYGDPLKKLVAAIAHVNPPRTLEDERPGNEELSDDGETELSTPEILIRPSAAASNDLRSPYDGNGSLNVVSDNHLGEIPIFSVPLRTRKIRDPLAGIGVKRKR